jgi:hypothetical protein
MVPLPTSSKLMSNVPPPRSNTRTTWQGRGQAKVVGGKGAYVWEALQTGPQARGVSSRPAAVLYVDWH